VAFFEAPLKFLSPPSTIFKRWHIDYLQLSKAKGYNCVLVCIDSLSLWSLLLPSKTTCAEESAKLLYDNVFMIYGCRTLVSDRGSAFRSKLLRSLCKLLDVTQVYTPSRHPQSNSRCESYNKNLLNALMTRCGSEIDWPDLLSTISHVFRTSVAKQLGHFRLKYFLDRDLVCRWMKCFCRHRHFLRMIKIITNVWSHN